MLANFKKEDANKIIVVGAEKAEAILISQLVDNSKLTTKEIVLEKYYDIDNDVDGFTIVVKDKAVI